MCRIIRPNPSDEDLHDHEVAVEAFRAALARYARADDGSPASAAIVEELLGTAPTATGVTVLMLACRLTSPEAVADMGMPQHEAKAERLMTAIVDGLEARGDLKAALRAQSKRQCTAMMMAAEEGHLSALKLLVERGGKGVIDEPRDEANRTPLGYAVSGGYIDAVRWLLEQGADPTVVRIKIKADEAGQMKNMDGRTLLMQASHMGHTAVR